MTAPEYEELYAFCVNLFGKDAVSRDDYSDPTAIELTVKTAKYNSDVDHVTLVLDRSNYPQSFMHVGSEFTFEFDDKEAHGISEMKRYLTALSEKRLAVKRTKIFGFTISSKLEIES